MKWIHIVAGVLSLLSGAMALYAVKGGAWHRRSGTVFFGAMLVMASSGALMASILEPNPVNVMAGSLTCYFVLTGWLAVKRSVDEARAALVGLMLAALALGAFAWVLVILAAQSPRGLIGGVPWPPLALFGTLGLLGALLDARMLRAGGLRGAQRVARHLWRMGFAMWVATSSFFLGQPRVFPDFLRENVGLRAIPVLLVVAVVGYWLVRTLMKRKRAIVVAGGSQA
jgi:hypothetical protein